MVSTMKFLGIDVGGTKIAWSVIDKRIRTREQNKVSVPRTRKRLVATLREIIKLYEDITATCIAFPGIIIKGRLVRAPNLKFMEGFFLKNLKRGLDFPVYFENDANVFAYGEAKLRGFQTLIGITLGSGVGGGVIIEGSIYHGSGGAGELGHITFCFGGERCSCGKEGCAEAYLSRQFFLRKSREVFGVSMEPEELFLLARKGNKVAKAIFREFGKMLGNFLASIANAFHPEAIVVGGGIVRGARYFVTQTRREFAKRTIVEPLPRLLFSRRDASLGAAILAREKYMKSED